MLIELESRGYSSRIYRASNLRFNLSKKSLRFQSFGFLHSFEEIKPYLCLVSHCRTDLDGRPWWRRLPPCRTPHSLSDLSYPLIAVGDVWSYTRLPTPSTPAPSRHYTSMPLCVVVLRQSGPFSPTNKLCIDSESLRRNAKLTTSRTTVTRKGGVNFRDSFGYMRFPRRKYTEED